MLHCQISNIKMRVLTGLQQPAVQKHGLKLHSSVTDSSKNVNLIANDPIRWQTLDLRFTCDVNRFRDSRRVQVSTPPLAAVEIEMYANNILAADGVAEKRLRGPIAKEKRIPSNIFKGITVKG